MELLYINDTVHKTSAHSDRFDKSVSRLCLCVNLFIFFYSLFRFLTTFHVTSLLRQLNRMLRMFVDRLNKRCAWYECWYKTKMNRWKWSFFWNNEDFIQTHRNDCKVVARDNLADESVILINLMLRMHYWITYSIVHIRCINLFKLKI